MHLLRVCVALLPFLLTGCDTMNVAQCTLPDTPANRVATTNIVDSVASKHGFVGHPERAVQDALLASYEFLGDSPKHPLNLDAYANDGMVTARLSQTKKKKKRTDNFLSAERDLVSQFKQRFGNGVQVDIYSEETGP
jgi:hypothetical protein